MFCNTCGRELRPQQNSCTACSSPVLLAAPSPAPAAPNPATTLRRGRINSFWNRVTEGQAVNQLWSELRTDARTSYPFYTRDIDRETLQGISKVRRHQPA